MEDTQETVELSVNSILARYDDFLKEAGTREYRALAGLEAFPSEVDRNAPLAEVTHPETVAYLRELLTSPRIDSNKQARVERLLATLLGLATRVRLGPSTDTVNALLRSRTVVAAARTFSLEELLRDGWSLQTVEARALVSSERAAVFATETSVFSRRADVLPSVCALLGLPSALVLVEATHRRTFQAAEVSGEAALLATDDAARDLTAFALKKLEGHLTLSGARDLDLDRALEAPWTFELLRKEDLSHAVTRMMGDLSFHPNATGRILIDSEARPQRVDGQHLVRVEVPDQLRLVLNAVPGFRGYAGWLGAWGEAQLLAATPRALPFIDRVVGQSALPLAVRRLFESVLLDEAFLKRAVRVTSPQARELARLFAWRQLLQLRTEVATLSVTRELLERGAVNSVNERFEAVMQRARGVPTPGALALARTDLLAPALPSLDAWALEASLLGLIRERFNEDWWRNPAAGRFLGDLAARGVTEDSATIAATFGAEGPSVLEAARRRVAVMGA